MQSPATFDYTSEELKGAEYWDALRNLQKRGPVVWVDSLGGYWAATSYDAVLQVAQDWRTFSSADGVALGRPGPDALPWIMPIEVDPPRQRTYRKHMNPQFVPKMMAPHEEDIRAIADELIDTFIDAGTCDLAVDFARKFPGTALLPPDRSVRGRGVPHGRAVGPNDHFRIRQPREVRRGAANLRAWAGRVFAARKASPGPTRRSRRGHAPSRRRRCVR